MCASATRGNPAQMWRVQSRVLSLRLYHRDADPARNAWWPLVAATVATWSAFMGVLVSLPYVVPATDSRRVEESAGERIILVQPWPAPSDAAETPRSAALPSRARTQSRRIADVPAVDTGTVAPTARATVTPDRLPVPPSLSPDATWRLARPLPEHAGGWSVPRITHDPFAAPAPPAPAERDSVLVALSTMTPEAAARRAPTRAERDSTAKEAMRKVRQSSRILLVPPDNSGGMITAPLPFLSGGPSRAQRARDQLALDEGRARLLRLQARVDSLRRARADSLPR